MMEQARSGREGLRYAVALIEIWGGLNGLFGLGRDIESTATKIPVTLMPGIAIIALVLIASLVAGVALWHDRRWGYTLSVPVQLFQVVWFVSPSLTFRIAGSGWILADLLLRYADEQVSLAWQIDLIHKGAYALSLAPRAEITVAVNLIALAILVWLGIRLRQRQA